MNERTQGRKAVSGIGFWFQFDFPRNILVFRESYEEKLFSDYRIRTIFLSGWGWRSSYARKIVDPNFSGLYIRCDRKWNPPIMNHIVISKIENKIHLILPYFLLIVKIDLIRGFFFLLNLIVRQFTFIVNRNMLAESSFFVFGIKRGIALGTYIYSGGLNPLLFIHFSN